MVRASATRPPPRRAPRAKWVVFSGHHQPPAMLANVRSSPNLVDGRRFRWEATAKEAGHASVTFSYKHNGVVVAESTVEIEVTETFGV